MTDARDVHVLAAGEVSMVPASPAAAKALFLYAAPLSQLAVPDARDVHVVPSGEVSMVPASPTATKVLFP